MNEVAIAPNAAGLLKRLRAGPGQLEWRPGDPAAVLAVVTVAECDAALERRPAAVLVIASPGERPPPGLLGTKIPHGVAYLPLSLKDLQQRVAWLASLHGAGAGQAFTDRESRLHRLAVAGRLAATAVHEVGNALAYASSSVDYLARFMAEVVQGVPDLSAAAEQVREGVHRALEASQLVLDLARESRPRARPVDVTEILKRTLKLSSAHAPPRVRFDRELGAVPPVLGDRAALAQVFTNLLLNAVDAAGPSGTIRVRAEAAAGKVVISVADSGPGIPPQIAPVLFQPFATTKADGTGLGLSLSRELVQMLGGTLEAGRGSLGGAELKVTLRAAGRRRKPGRP